MPKIILITALLEVSERLLPAIITVNIKVNLKFAGETLMLVKVTYSILECNLFHDYYLSNPRLDSHTRSIGVSSI